MLADRQIPFILHTAAHLERRGWDQHDHVPLLIKPVQPRTVVACLVMEMRRSDRTTSKIVSAPNLNSIS
jgi:hypothetical protein